MSAAAGPVDPGHRGMSSGLPFAEDATDPYVILGVATMAMGSSSAQRMKMAMLIGGIVLRPSEHARL